ncbi:MAG TPA: FecR domain-containing protein [Polyangiaceae bacterium]
MNELEPLGAALRRELGAPPDAWQEAQRVRLRHVLREAPRRAGYLGFVPILSAALVLAAALVWVAVRPSTSETERWLVAEELREPYRFDDGSSIALAPGGRGRLFTDASAVRFDLHQGQASFDVTPGQRRQWTISAGKNEVRVVGTRFSVLYGPAETFEVMVERGVVSVRVPSRKASVELQAGNHLRGRPGHLEVARAAPASPPALAPVPVEAGAVALATSAEPPSSAASGPALTEWQARYRAGKYAESLALLRTSGLAQRLDELSAATLADVADAARLGGDTELAVRALRTLLRRFPGAPEARDGKFLLGRVQALRGDTAAAVVAFEGYLARGGGTQYANEAVGRLMELYSARGDGDRARTMARRYLEKAPDGPYRRLARSLLAEAK